MGRSTRRKSRQKGESQDGSTSRQATAPQAQRSEDVRDGAPPQRARRSSPPSSYASSRPAGRGYGSGSAHQANVFSPPAFPQQQQHGSRTFPTPITIDSGRPDIDLMELNRFPVSDDALELFGDYPAMSPPRSTTRQSSAGGFHGDAENKPPSSSSKQPMRRSTPAQFTPSGSSRYDPQFHDRPRRSPMETGAPIFSSTPSSIQGLPSSYYSGTFSATRHSSPASMPSPVEGFQPGYPPFFQYHPDQWESDYFPPSASKKRRAASPRRIDTGGTPEKKAIAAFPSPAKKFARSPFCNPSPNLGTYGSFGGVETPNAMLGPGTFSPMGTSMEEPLPFPDHDGEWDLVKTASQDGNDTPRLRRNKESPLSTYFTRSPTIDGMEFARSPLNPSGARRAHRPASGQRRAAPVTLSNRPEPRIVVETPRSGFQHKPRNLWPSSESSSTPGHVRVELGNARSDTRKTLTGINDMMIHSSMKGGPRGSSTPSTTTSSYGSSTGYPPLATPYRADLATPVKHGRPSPYQGHGPPGPPSSARRQPMYLPPPGLQAVPPNSSPYGVTPSLRLYPGRQLETPSTVPAPTTLKEGSSKKKKSLSSGKRTPCNCKKSKCLKLYCECFASERFCKDCNCADCGNSPSSDQGARDKAFKDTRTKNPGAFKNKFGSGRGLSGGSPQNTHTSGCRCKKSECLKKYCECFDAGVICGTKCKCSGCRNYAGSQALIDKRRKIKDQRGADFAMRVADEAWKSGGGGKRPAPPVPRGITPNRHPSQLPPHRHGPPPGHLIHPSPRGLPPPPRGHPAGRPYMGHYMGPPPAGYPPFPPTYPRSSDVPHGMYPPPMPPGHPVSAIRKPNPPKPPAKKADSPPKNVETPKRGAVKVNFDPVSSRKKRNISKETPEEKLSLFGAKNVEQPKTTALNIFSFLWGEDLYNASLVCKRWSKLAKDEELVQFPT